MYIEGRGVPQDDAEAAKRFRKAAEQNDAFAQFVLAGMYIEGRGVPNNCAEAAKWYQKAAEQNHADAQFNLGVMYTAGIGVPEDDVMAYKWFKLAAKRLNKAVAKLDELAGTMTAEQIAEAQGLLYSLTPLESEQELE
jgi:uncharacterized protein